MAFETKQEILNWYEKQPRALTPEFISSIPWEEVKRYPLDERFVPVMFYMRDVETLTDMYHRQMLRTPTGKDPHIAKFMERWGVEELTHGEVINRFLEEAGYRSDEKWQRQVRRAVTRSYHANTYIQTLLTNLFGKHFTATHMTVGAIHEMSTLQGYRRLMKLANHPVLSHILNAIIREESTHSRFYSSVAKLELRGNAFAQKVAKLAVEHFWVPVGQGSLAKARTDYLIRTLFEGVEGLKWIETNVSSRLRTFPGLSDVTRVTEKIARVTQTPVDAV